MTGFTDRLEKADLPKNGFLCTVVNQAPYTDNRAMAVVESALPPDQGVWERIDAHFMVIVLWDKNALGPLLEKIKTALDSDPDKGVAPITGSAVFPFLEFSRKETVYNAVKAVDHAAFLGPGSNADFGDISLNISGDRLYQLGFLDEAAAEYQKGLAINEKNTNLMNSLGVCHGMNNNPEQAKKIFERALAKDSNEVMVVYNMGIVCSILEHDTEALYYLEQASRLDNSIFEVELTTGNLLLKAGRLDDARVHLSRAKHLNARTGLPYRLLGEYFLGVQDIARAIAEFKQAVKLNPMDAVSLSGLAQGFCLTGKNLNIAITLAKESIGIDPDTPLFRSRLGDIYLQTGQKELAQAAFDLAEQTTGADTSRPQKRLEKRSA